MITDFRNSLQRLSQRLGLGRFLAWWLGELSAMVPHVLSGAARTTRRLLVELTGGNVKFSQVAAGEVSEVGRLNMPTLDVAGQKLAFQSELNQIGWQKTGLVLSLPPEKVLRKNFFLPLAAEENLRQVLAFEMDRHTPFKADQVYFDYRLARFDKQIEVSLVVSPRPVIDEPLRQLAAWGAQVTAVVVADDATEDVPWNLLPAGQRQKGKDTRLTRLNIALASGAVILLCVALALPIWQQRETVLALHPLLDKAHQQATQAEGLRRQFEALLAEYNFLLDKKREIPPVVAVLDDATRILPDDTWVQQFDLKGKEMQIQGETSSSSKLAGLFEQAKTLHNASFRSPLTKGQSGNSERFQLAADTRPLPRAETQPPPPVQPVAGQPQSAVPAPQPLAPPEAAKADSKPAVTENKPVAAPAARTGGKP